MENMKDLYSLLGVPISASDEQIKKAYHDAVKKYHPDRYSDNRLRELAQERLKLINGAYDVIMKARNDVRCGDLEHLQYDSCWEGIRYGNYDGRTWKKDAFERNTDHIINDSSAELFYCKNNRRWRRNKKHIIIKLCCSYLEGDCFRWL